MIRIPFVPPGAGPPGGDPPDQTAWWLAWATRASAANTTYLQARSTGATPQFNKAIWIELKEWLLDHVFHGKCAYCEGEVYPVSWGEGEHFRPKGNVSFCEADHGVRKKRDAGHPGYYWLAYDYRNLLPACSPCNNAKSDQFPVGSTHQVNDTLGPQALDTLERPLLINPYFEDPAEFLCFDDLGHVAAIDNNPRGLETIAVFDLNRERLITARFRAQDRVVADLGDALKACVRSRVPIDVSLASFIGPDAPYSAAVRGFVNRCLSTIGEIRI